MPRAHPFRKTIAVSIAYLAASVVATVVAVQRDLPAAILDQTAGKTARQTLMGNGTALAAPPYMLAILAVLTALVAVRWRGRSYAAGAVVAYGLLSLLGSVFEPIVRRVFPPGSFDLVPALCIVSVAGTALLMIVFGCAELVGYRRLRGADAASDPAGRPQ